MLLNGVTVDDGLGVGLRESVDGCGGACNEFDACDEGPATEFVSPVNSLLGLLSFARLSPLFTIFCRKL